MSHNPSPVLLQKRLNICLLFFVTMGSCFVSTMVQLSSHNWPSEMRLWLRFLKIFVFVGLSDRDCMDKLPYGCAWMHDWFGRIVVVSGLLYLMFERIIYCVRRNNDLRLQYHPWWLCNVYFLVGLQMNSVRNIIFYFYYHLY